MLLSLSFRGPDAQDLSWLLHKNPARFQTFDLSFGKAHVFFNNFSPELATANLLLEISPRTREKDSFGQDFHFVNDEEYICSSFMSVAIGKVFGSALKGVCGERPELPAKARNAEAVIVNFPCRHSAETLERIFAPLGLEADFKSNPLATAFPEWGDCPHGVLTLKGRAVLKDILGPLSLLIPFFDRRIHYWLAENELENFIRLGSPWLENHPEKEFIISGYFRQSADLRHKALEAFNALPSQRPKSLNQIRHEAIVNKVAQCGARAVIDLGCGEGKLLEMLQKTGKGYELAGMDISMRSLANARKRLDSAGSSRSVDCRLFQGCLTCRDKRLTGYDTAILCEVIEHVDRDRIDAVMLNILGFCRPRTLILTTPNHAYNKLYPALAGEEFRHADHRYELSAEEFQAWAMATAARFGYIVQFENIGEVAAEVGAPTLMGVFRR